MFQNIVDTVENRLFWIIYDNGDMQSATVDGCDVKTIISTNSAGNKVAIGVFGNTIFYADNKQLLMVTKIPGSTPTVLYNDTMRIESIFVFNQLGMFYLQIFHKETVSIMIHSFTI